MANNNKKFDNIMIDLETIGVCADALVLTIGAVPFSFDGEMGKEFEIYPTVQDQIGQRKVEWGALQFWFNQEDVVRHQQSDAIRTNNLETSLNQLTEFCQSNLDSNFKVWGNGFDIPLLNQAYSSYGMETPWSYKKIMDCRTITWLSKISTRVHIDESDLKHNAVSDCKYQIRFIVDAFHVLKGY